MKKNGKSNWGKKAGKRLVYTIEIINESPHRSDTFSLSGSMSTATTAPPPTAPCVLANIATANSLPKER